MFQLFKKNDPDRENESLEFEGPESDEPNVGRLHHLLLDVLLFPARVLCYPFEGLVNLFYRFAFHDHADDEISEISGGVGAAIWFWMKRVGWFLLLLPFQLIKAPFDFIAGLTMARMRDVVFVLPALAMIGFFGFVFVKNSQSQLDIEQQYVSGARKALFESNVKLAKTYYSRIVGDRPLKSYEKLQWALILHENGDHRQAERLLDELAPDEGRKYSPAHRMKALSLAQFISNNSAIPRDPDILKKFRAHLDYGNDDSDEMLRAWAIYYLAVDDVENATRYLRSAAENEPRFWLSIADVNRQKGRHGQADEALKKAEVAFRKKVSDDPLDVGSRVTLANVLAQTQQLDAAEELLLAGLKLQPTNQLRREIAGFYLLRQADAAERQQSFEEQFAFIQKAISMDENFPPIYLRLEKIYSDLANEDDRQAIKDSLFDIVSGDHPSPTAHLALSNALWIEGERAEAQWHLEQAYQLDPGYAVVINNLAWMLSQKVNPELDRAEKLILSVLKELPDDPRVIDTYANVLMGQNRYTEAVTQFQKALPGTSDPREISGIHANLARCYDALGKTKLAALHRQKVAVAGE